VPTCLPPPCNLHKIARQTGVRLIDAADNRSIGRPDGLYSCKASAKAIGSLHGEAHLALCFRLLTETGNGKAIHAASLKAVSALLLSGYVEIDGTLFYAFDKTAQRLPSPPRKAGERPQ